MTINIDDYLSEEEKHSIAKEVFIEQCRKRSADDFERIITNSAYHVVWDSMDEFCDKSVMAKLRNKVRNIIDGLTEFTVFRQPDAWHKRENTPYSVLLESVRENKPLLDQKVKAAMSKLSTKDAKQIAIKAFEDSFKN
jgi:hypothetical protein